MPCLPSATKAALEARRARLVTSLTLAHDTYDELLAVSVEKYRLDTAEGSQSSTRRKLEELWGNIELIQRSIDSIDQRLRGTGISRINLARYGGRRF